MAWRTSRTRSTSHTSRRLCVDISASLTRSKSGSASPPRPSSSPSSSNPCGGPVPPGRGGAGGEVWQGIGAKGEGHILKYARGGLGKTLRKPGAALRLLQQQWQDLLAHFDDVFLQPVIYFPPGFLRNCPLISFTVNAGSAERIAELAVRVGRRSVLAAVMPEAGPGSRCRIWCNPPSGQLPVLLRFMKEYHRGSGSPVFGLVDIEATRRLAQPPLCRFFLGCLFPPGV